MERKSSTDIISRERHCMKQLKEKIKGDKDLECFSTILTERFLLHFVRGKKYDSKKAFHVLKAYIHVRNDKYRDIFITLLPSRLPVTQQLIRVLKYRDSIGRIVGVSRAVWWDFDTYSIEEMFKTAILYYEEAWNHEATERYGTVNILDAKGFNLRQAREATPTKIQKLVSLLWNAFPLKYHEIHIINAPIYFTMMYNVIKTFLPPKLRKRVQIHGQDFTNFHKIIPPNFLPEYFGGTLLDEEAYDLDFGESILQKEEYYRALVELICRS